HVLDRQKERDSEGDNVSYVLARTGRSNLQYLAAQEIGLVGREPMPAAGNVLRALWACFAARGRRAFLASKYQGCWEATQACMCGQRGSRGSALESAVRHQRICGRQATRRPRDSRRFSSDMYPKNTRLPISATQRPGCPFLGCWLRRR
ncbi:unnamed protein product, partial [Ectocarpus sp. 8 AP-2014]